MMTFDMLINNTISSPISIKINKIFPNSHIYRYFLLPTPNVGLEIFIELQVTRIQNERGYDMDLFYI